MHDVDIVLKNIKMLHRFEKDKGCSKIIDGAK